MRDVHLLVFGTSTTYGAWDIEGGWVQRLRKFLDQKVIDSDYKAFYLVYNQGVSGDKSEDILNRFEVETKARLNDSGEDIILFHVGINDSIYNEKLRSTEVFPKQFRENLTKLINLAKKYSQKIILIGSMPVDQRVDPMPWAPGRSYKNEYVEQFNKIIKEVAKKEGVDFIEVFQRFVNKDYSKLLADGVHMNSKGHQKLYELVRDFLVVKNAIQS